MKRRRSISRWVKSAPSRARRWLDRTLLFPILDFIEARLAPLRRLAERRPVQLAVRVVRAVVTSRLVWALTVLAALGVFIWPEIVVRRARVHATECLAKARAPRGRELPDCSPIVEEFIYPAGVSYTEHDATYRGEELIARIAINAYVDAAVGDPDRVRLDAGALAVLDAQGMLEAGSRRVSLDELGPAVGSPHMGKLASALGDRMTLLNHSDELGLWYIKRDALEAALLEADFEELDELARKYSAEDLSDAPDMQTMVGASLCIASPGEGTALLEPIPAHRAEKRYANLQRNFGELYAAIEGCTAKLGYEPDPYPRSGPGGSADQPEVRAIAELRVSRRGPRREALVREAIEMLGRQLGYAIDSKAPFARAMMLAAVLTQTDEPLSAELLADLSRSRTDEGELAFAPAGLSLRTILVEAPGLHPIVPAAWLRSGGQTLLASAETAKKPEQTAALERAAGGLFTLAAREFAMNGDVEAAIATAERGARLSKLGPHGSALSVASTAYVAGSPKIAADVIAAAPAAGTDADTLAIELDLATLRVLVAASLGDADTLSRAVSDLANRTLDANSPDVSLDARWAVVAFAPKRVDAPPIPAWTGQADDLARYRERGEPAISQALATWSAALVKPADERRAFRYTLLDRRGDMPAMALAYLVAGAKLLDEPATDDAAEIWLDALTSIDARRLRLRSYAWMRLEAARIRKDAYYTALWTERLAVLRDVARDEDNLEVSRFLRF